MSYDVNVYNGNNHSCGCSSDSGDVITFTSEEINLILADGPVNCSTRFSTFCRDKVRELTLDKALELVPQKFRTAARLLMFLNEKGLPELWIYRGVTERTWFDLKYWVNIPTEANSFSDIYTTLDNLDKRLFKVEEKIQNCVTSTTIKGIEVVEKASGKLDDILYFEYLPAPEFSVYDIQAGYLEPVVSNDRVDFDINLYTKVIGEKGYNKVRLLMEVVEKPKTSHVDLNYVDRDGVQKNAMDLAYYGGEGFAIAPDFSENIPVGMVFSESGFYSLRFSLVEVGTGTKIEFYNMSLDVQ